MTSSINAGVNQTFSMTLSVAMIYLVVNEALLFNIFTRALYKIMQRDIFSFLIFINPTRVIQATIPGGGGGGEGFDTWPMDYHDRQV